MAIDGAALVHLLPVNNVSTFDEYASMVFVPHIAKQLQKSTRVDLVWDTDIDNSVKSSTRQKRGKGIRRKVAGKHKVPGYWREFLQDEINKKELFDFLSQKIASAEYPDGKEVFVTSGMGVLTKGTSRQMIPCDHEEADTRLMVHVIDSLNAGCSKCLVRTVDTDVVVILVGKFHHLLTLNLSAKIWAAFGTGKFFCIFGYQFHRLCSGRAKIFGLTCIS